MKRATRRHLLYVREFLRLDSPRVAEAWFHEAVAAVLAERDSAAERDARQRAEIRRLRKALNIVAAGACKVSCPEETACDGCLARAALRPAKVTR